MQRIKYLIVFLLIVNSFLAFSQSDVDSALFKKFPTCIGNIGFAIDSNDIVVGDIPRGEISTFSYEIYNFGKESIVFTNGSSNNFVSQQFQPDVLPPATSGMMIVNFNANYELELGDFDSEISIISNDVKNPYKFLNIYMNIVEGLGGTNANAYDTVPHIVFDHYNYDYGHLTRGKVQYHTFIITNEGSESLIINELTLPKGTTVVDSPTEPLLAGEKYILRLKINTRGRVGVQHQSVLVHSNDPSNPLVILGLHGSVRIYPSHKKTSVQCNEHQQRF